MYYATSLLSHSHGWRTLVILVASAMIIPAILAQDNTASEIVIYKADDEYIYQGCYTETNDINGTEKRRALPDANKVAKGELVVPDCLDFCEEGGYPWAGVQFSRECWCGHFLSAFSEKVDDRQCNTTCDGNVSMACGGSQRLSVYHKDDASLSALSRTILWMGVIVTTALSILL